MSASFLSSLRFRHLIVVTLFLGGLALAWTLRSDASAAAPTASVHPVAAQATDDQGEVDDESLPKGTADGESPLDDQSSVVPTNDPAQLFANHCAGCHGDDAQGLPNRGPDIRDEGKAAVDFVLRTGRMPMSNPNMQAWRGPVRFTNEQIEALVEYVGSKGDGPDIPNVDVANADVVNGGYLYRENCAACHVASGAGAAIGGGKDAPSLMAASPTEIGEAILVGPGVMPRLSSLSESEISDVAAYIGKLQADKTTSPRHLGGAGPVAEGATALILGLLPIIAITRWIGSSQRPKKTPDEAYAEQVEHAHTTKAEAT